MKSVRRKIRYLASRLVGVQGDIALLWNRDLPIIYVNNPKSGCSTIKHTMKKAQAAEYIRRRENFVCADDPHTLDDCLRKAGLRLEVCRRKAVISCVRNPFTRILSAYLDKVAHGDGRLLGKLSRVKLDTFEKFLVALSQLKPRDINKHFRPQCINLNYPNIKYYAIFFLENMQALGDLFAHVAPGLSIESFAPHARFAASALRAHYTDRAVELVKEIFADDFRLFGYGERLDDAGVAPGELILDNRVMPRGTQLPDFALHQGDAPICPNLKATVRFLRAVELRLV